MLEATGPGQVWSWDITDLRSPWRGVAFKGYSIIDIYSRKLVGYRVEDREADHLAVEMFTDAFAAQGLPSVVHADSGPAMRSTLLADLLAPPPWPKPTIGPESPTTTRSPSRSSAR